MHIWNFKKIKNKSLFFFFEKSEILQKIKNCLQFLKLLEKSEILKFFQNLPSEKKKKSPCKIIKTAQKCFLNNFALFNFFFFYLFDNRIN